MTTLLHLSQSISDIQNDLAREQRFSADARRNLMNGVKIIREAIDALERDIVANFDERDRAVSRMIGNSHPFTTVIENANMPKPEIIVDQGEDDGSPDEVASAA